MKKNQKITVIVLFCTIVTISIIIVVLSYNKQTEDKVDDTDRTTFIKEENDNTNPALPTVSPDLEN